MEKKNKEIKQILKRNIRSKECDFGLSCIDWNDVAFECENRNCPFYIVDNDSGYYQYCIIGQVIQNIRDYIQGKEEENGN